MVFVFLLKGTGISGKLLSYFKKKIGSWVFFFFFKHLSGRAKCGAKTQ